MLKDLFTLPGGFPIHSYGLMVLLGALSGIWLLRREARRQGWDPQRCADIAVFAILLGLVGARTFYVIQFWEEQFADNFWDVFKVWQGGLVLFGAILTGFAVLMILPRRAGIPILGYLDIGAPAVAIGIAFGRIGCYLNGCCWGKVCPPEFVFAVNFPADSPPGALARRLGHAPADYWVHPTQLYSSLGALLICILLLWVQSHRPRPRGVVVAVFLMLYGVMRFSVEAIRGDHSVDGLNFLQGELTVSQKLAIAAVTAGLALFAWARKQPRIPVVDLAQAAD